MTCYLPLLYLSFVPRRIILPTSLPHSYPTIPLTVDYIQVNHVYYTFCLAAKSLGTCSIRCSHSSFHLK